MKMGTRESQDQRHGRVFGAVRDFFAGVGTCWRHHRHGQKRSLTGR